MSCVISVLLQLFHMTASHCQWLLWTVGAGGTTESLTIIDVTWPYSLTWPLGLLFRGNPHIKNYLKNPHNTLIRTYMINYLIGILRRPRPFVHKMFCFLDMTIRCTCVYEQCTAIHVNNRLIIAPGLLEWRTYTDSYTE